MRRNGEIGVVVGLVDERKDAIWDSDVEKDEEELAGLCQNPIEIGLTRQAFSPRWQGEEPVLTFGSETGGNIFRRQRCLHPLIRPPQ